MKIIGNKFKNRD